MTRAVVWDTARPVPVGYIDGESDEEWRPVPGWPLYEISNRGRVKSFSQRPGLLKTQTDKWGYRKVRLHASPHGRTFYLHALVAAAFLGPRPEGHDTRHLDGDKSNNSVENLAYGTHRENMEDSLRHGSHAQAAKTECPAGHPYNADNTYVTPSGERDCRTCAAARKRAWRAGRSYSAAALKQASEATNVNGDLDTASGPYGIDQPDPCECSKAPAGHREDQCAE